jgi:hypothetical protein
MGLSIGWTFIMAGAIVAGLATFIFLVLRADRTTKTSGAEPAQDPGKHRDVIGGRFEATGGRQVTPRRDVPPAELTDPGKLDRETTGREG